MSLTVRLVSLAPPATKRLPVSELRTGSSTLPEGYRLGSIPSPSSLLVAAGLIPLPEATVETAAFNSGFCGATPVPSGFGGIPFGLASV